MSTKNRQFPSVDDRRYSTTFSFLVYIYLCGTVTKKSHLRVTSLRSRTKISNFWSVNFKLSPIQRSTDKTTLSLLSIVTIKLNWSFSMYCPGCFPQFSFCSVRGEQKETGILIICYLCYGNSRSSCRWETRKRSRRIFISQSSAEHQPVKQSFIIINTFPRGTKNSLKIHDERNFSWDLSLCGQTIAVWFLRVLTVEHLIL